MDMKQRIVTGMGVMLMLCIGAVAAIVIGAGVWLWGLLA